MGKPGKYKNQECFKRMNYLLQASHLMAGLDPNLSKFYNNSLKQVAQRNVLRIDRDVKRVVCLRCDVSLVPGVTSHIYAGGKKEKYLCVKCKECGHIRRFKIPSEDRKATKSSEKKQRRGSKEKVKDVPPTEQSANST
eukprot:GFYU01018796.1.p1 GENE.GFYU01018796.1~~GFYU01018796.1.p1  ORF type:complete len:138 (+),score=20.57 GFYU01018796.1:79-492(+)